MAVSRQLCKREARRPGDVGASVLPVRELDVRRHPEHPGLPRRHGRLRPADRLRERGQPAAGCRSRQAEGTGLADGGGCRSRAADEAAGDRESAAVTGSAAACGIGLAVAGTRLYPLLVPGDFPALLRQRPIDARVLAFALAISVALERGVRIAPGVAGVTGGPESKRSRKGAERRRRPAAAGASRCW